jgi:predicted RNA-binding protein YlxR (DUF448 family)
MIRVIRSSTGEVKVDEGGKEPGRGAYLCPDRNCWATALKERRLDRALRVRLNSEEGDRLQAYADEQLACGDGNGEV